LISFSDLRPKFSSSAFGFGLLDQFADGLNVRVLQAVVAAHGEFELLDRTVEVFVLISGRRSSLAAAVSISSSKLIRCSCDL